LIQKGSEFRGGVRGNSKVRGKKGVRNTGCQPEGIRAKLSFRLLGVQRIRGRLWGRQGRIGKRRGRGKITESGNENGDALGRMRDDGNFKKLEEAGGMFVGERRGKQSVRARESKKTACGRGEADEHEGRRHGSSGLRRGVAAEKGGEERLEFGLKVSGDARDELCLLGTGALLIPNSSKRWCGESGGQIGGRGQRGGEGRERV